MLTPKAIIHKISVRIPISGMRIAMLRLLNRGKKEYCCPLCNYQGVFADSYPLMGERKDALCPSCLSLERHRLQFVTLKKVEHRFDFHNKRILHFAPEPVWRNYFQSITDDYHTADISGINVDFTIDMTAIPFEDESFDLVWASHVLEHIEDDIKALQEVKRILKPGGVAILPVPILSDQTVEYSEANEDEEMHWRSPGLDYFQTKYKEVFGTVEVFASEDFDPIHRVNVTSQNPQGEWYTENDYVPLCVKE